MSEKLTKEAVVTLAETYRWARGSEVETAVNVLWSAILADRETVRAEVTAELLKDHFKVGEEVDFQYSTQGKWVKGIVMAYDQKMHQAYPQCVRRPPKPRPMTREEIVAFIEGHGLTVKPGATVDDLHTFLRVLNIPTEVTE